MIDSKMTIKDKVTFPTVYSDGGECDESNASGQKVVKVAAPTAPFSIGDRVVIGKGTNRVEQGTIDSISADVSITLLANLTYNHTVDAETTVDVESGPGGDNKILSVAATTNFLVGETVIVDEGETHEATYIIASVQAGVSLTMTTVLAETHEVAETVTQAGVAGTVEICMASLSTALYIANYKIMSIFLPADWTTAGITFVGCITNDGTFNQIVQGSDVAEVAIASVAASKVIGLDGALKEALEGIAYIKLRSGTLAAPVDQGASGKTISISLKR